MTSSISIPKSVKSTRVQCRESTYLAFSNPRVVAVVVGVVRVVFPNGAEVGERDPESRDHPSPGVGYRSHIVLYTGFFPCKRGAGYEVGSQRFVGYVQVPSVVDFFHKTADQGLVFLR
jgi:hypothetical protein